jgi:hypothetical protein
MLVLLLLAGLARAEDRVCQVERVEMMLRLGA